MITNYFTLMDTNGVVQFVGQWASPDVWPSVSLGISVALGFFGFGMILRMGKKTSREM